MGTPPPAAVEARSLFEAPAAQTIPHGLGALGFVLTLGWPTWILKFWFHPERKRHYSFKGMHLQAHLTHLSALHLSAPLGP